MAKNATLNLDQDEMHDAIAYYVEHKYGVKVISTTLDVDVFVSGRKENYKFSGAVTYSLAEKT
jgi:hypothetical protein